MKATIRWIFLINGILGIWDPFEAVLGISTPPFALILFPVTFPISTIMIVVLFKKNNVYLSESRG
jgi:hypothetical protein